MRGIGALQGIAMPGNRHRLRWAVRVRWLVIAGFFALAVGAWQVGVLPSLRECAAAAIAGAALNAVNHWCVARWRFVRTVTALAIPADVVLITYVVIHTGGAQSPFFMMYVVQVVAAAMLVNFVVAGIGAAAAVACIAGALAMERAGVLQAAPLAAGGAWYQAIWALFLLYCLALLTYVGGYIAERLARSEKDLAAANQDLYKTIDSLERAHAELQQTCERLKATEAQLVQSEKMRALGQFVAGVAHELNNPLAFVAANIEHLERSVGAIERMLKAYADAAIAAPTGAALAEQRRALRVDDLLDDLPSLLGDCREGARRAVSIVSELRAFSRGEPGAGWARVDVRDGLERTLAFLRHRFGGKIAIERRYGAVPAVEGISGQLDQVFLNLLTNAADAVEDSGHIGVSTHLRVDPPAVPRPGPYVAVAVRDDGMGIPAELHGRVFDPFFTTKPEGKGTGLGLSVSYGIVERHGGAIAVESARGRGSTFTVYLPAAGAARSATGARSHAR